jgi:hypothetical protein
MRKFNSSRGTEAEDNFSLEGLNYLGGYPHSEFRRQNRL